MQSICAEQIKLLNFSAACMQDTPKGPTGASRKANLRLMSCLVSTQPAFAAEAHLAGVCERALERASGPDPALQKLCCESILDTCLFGTDNLLRTEGGSNNFGKAAQICSKMYTVMDCTQAPDHGVGFCQVTFCQGLPLREACSPLAITIAPISRTESSCAVFMTTTCTATRSSVSPPTRNGSPQLNRSTGSPHGRWFLIGVTASAL